MKKFALLMAGLMIAVLTGCSQNDGNASAPEAESASPQTEAAATATPVTENDDTQEETDIQEEAIAALADTVALKKVNVMSDKAVVLVPEQFNLMDEEMKAIKYPNANAPSEVYTNEDGSINVAISETGSPLTEADLEPFAEQMKTTLEPSAIEWYEDGLIEIGERKAGHIAFLSPGADGTQIYNHMVYAVMNDQLVIVTFNCLEEQMGEWQNVGDTIVKTILFNE